MPISYNIFMVSLASKETEVVENTLQVRAIAPGNFHLRGQGMERFLCWMTEAAEMEAFTIPIVLDPRNSETNLLSARHPLGGRKRARDENGFLGWRDSWVSACVYNGTRTADSVQLTVTAHACGSLPTDKLLRVIYSTVHPSRMHWGLLSSTDGAIGFRDYELEGDQSFKNIVDLLWKNSRSEAKKVELGQVLEREVLARRMLGLEQLDKLLLKHELRKLQRIFGDYEGILEQEAARKIITEGTSLDCFPFYQRYDQLTDTEIAGTEMWDVRKVCFVGGGWFPISAIFYALKTHAQIFVVEKDSGRAKTAANVVDSLNLAKRVTILNQRAEKVDYSGMDVVVLAAMVEPKHKILRKASETNFPRTIALRGPLGDNKALYPSFTSEELFGRVGQFLHHWPERYNLKADNDGIFSLMYLDSERVIYRP